MGKYLHTVGATLSQLLNALMFNSGNASECLSGRCWRQQDHWFFGLLRVVIDRIFLHIQEDHCFTSHQADVTRASKTLRNARL